MRHWHRALVPILVVLLAVGLRAVDPPFLADLRLKIFDAFQRLEPRSYTQVPVRVVDLDDESLSRVGQWPWPRTVMTELLERLSAAGAAAVAFDIVFAEPDRTSPANIATIWEDNPELAPVAGLLKALPDHDEQFALRLEQTASVLGFIGTQQDGDAPTQRAGLAWAGPPALEFLPRYVGAVAPIDVLSQAAPGVGSLNFTPDRDGIVRRVPLFVRVGDTIYPSLVSEALRVAQGARGFAIKSAGASGETSFGASTGITHAKIGQVVIPTDANGQLWVYYTPRQPSRSVPAWRVLAGQTSDELFDGALVFIGTSAAGLKDLRATPLNPSLAGVEIHAQATEQILTGTFLHRPDWAEGAEIVGLFLIGMALVVTVLKIGSFWGALLALSAIAAGTAASWMLFTQAHLLFAPLYPSIVITVVFLSASVSNYLKSETQRRQVRSAFSHYMSPVLVEQLARHPDQLHLGGEMREMTLLFCDVRNFTRLSEMRDPEGLTTLINRFLTPMTQAILDRNGVIDKYMGDAIMAFWNAPLDDPAHARHACEAVISMREQLEELNQALFREGLLDETTGALRIGVGLSTGQCCVGNLGSEQRFDYSVLGDTVNLASRLEGQTKEYAVSAIISEATYKAATDHAALELDLIQVKGRETPERIYALIGSPALRDSQTFLVLQDIHARLLAAYRRQAWSEARLILRQARKAAKPLTLDGLYDVYEERIAVFEKRAPMANWDGVFHATRK